MYKLLFLLHQEQITVEIKVHLSLLPKSIFQRLMTHVSGLVTTFTPWKKGFSIEEDKDYAMFCEVIDVQGNSTLKFKGRFIKGKKTEFWDHLQNVLKVINYVIVFLFRFLELIT